MRKIIKFIILLFYKIYLKKTKHVIIHPSINMSKSTIFEGYNKINRKVNIVNSFIGKGTYIGESTHLPNSKIGRFCSIARGVKVLPYTHPSSINVSTHPAFFSLLEQAGFTLTDVQSFQEVLYVKGSKKFVEIGNDAWIGEDVKILGGITIGDGSIIATGSIVTKDVEPYTIVGGIPAKFLKYRFEEKEIEFLKNTKWWNNNFSILKSNNHLFLNIKDFIKSWDK